MEKIKRPYGEKVRKILDRDYQGLYSLLQYVFNENFGVSKNPKILNIGGVNSLENEALYKVFGKARITVMDCDKERLENLDVRYILSKVHNDATNMPLLALQGYQFDIIFSRHPPILEEIELEGISGDDAGKKTVEKVWDGVLKQLYFGNVGGLTLITFYKQSEYEYAAKHLKMHELLRHGKNPHSVVITPHDNRLLCKAGLAIKGLLSEKESIVRDNFYLLARNTFELPVENKSIISSIKSKVLGK
jgi:hypothetical protein